MAEPFAPYAGIEGAALTGGEGGDALHNLLLGIIGGTVSVPERVIKAAQATAPGLRREDFTDIPGAAQPGAEMRQGALEAAMMTMGATPFGMAAPRAGEVAMGAGPIRTTAYKAMDTASPNMAPETGLSHVALDRRVAEQFAGGGRRKVNEVEVSAQKPFDFRDPADLQWLVGEMKKPENVAAFNRDTKRIMGEHYDFHHDARNIQAGLDDGLYQAYEVPHVVDLIKRKGYDGIFMVEDAGAPVNLAIFSPSQIALKGLK